MTFVPQFILRRMYVNGSLRALDAQGSGAAFNLTNALGPGVLTQLSQIRLDDATYDASQITLRLSNPDRAIAASDVSEASPLRVAMGESVACEIPGARLTPGRHEIQIAVVTREAGAVSLTVEDELASA